MPDHGGLIGVEASGSFDNTQRIPENMIRGWLEATEANIWEKVQEIRLTKGAGENPFADTQV
jgi:hypothetical protein